MAIKCRVRGGELFGLRWIDFIPEPWPVLPKGNQADNPINKLDPDLVVADLIGYFRATARVDIRLTLLLAFHFLSSPLTLKTHTILSLSLSFCVILDLIVFSIVIYLFK